MVRHGPSYSCGRSRIGLRDRPTGTGEPGGAVTSRLPQSAAHRGRPADINRQLSRNPWQARGMDASVARVPDDGARDGRGVLGGVAVAAESRETGCVPRLQEMRDIVHHQRHLARHHQHVLHRVHTVRADLAPRAARPPGVGVGRRDGRRTPPPGRPVSVASPQRPGGHCAPRRTACATGSVGAAGTPKPPTGATASRGERPYVGQPAQCAGESAAVRRRSVEEVHPALPCRGGGRPLLPAGTALRRPVVRLHG